MDFDVQRASLTKRLSAWLLDVILLVCLTVGLAALFSSLFGFDRYNAQLDEAYAHYGEVYDVDFNISAEDYEKLTEEDLVRYNAAAEALNKDEKAVKAYSMIINLTMAITALSILFAYALLELAVPLWLRNGQTVGKKVFGIALMRTDGVRVTPFMMFARTVLGKYTLETMIPVLIILMLLFQIIGLTGTIVLVLILILQLGLLFGTRNHSAIHDLLACTVAVDLESQRMFDSPQDRLDYQKRMKAEEASRAKY